jgi:hypothetical protein
MGGLEAGGGEGVGGDLRVVGGVIPAISNLCVATKDGCRYQFPKDIYLEK